MSSLLLFAAIGGGPERAAASPAARSVPRRAASHRAVPPRRGTPPRRAADPAKPGGKAAALPLFEEGIKLFDGGYYHRAIQKFQRAYFHFPSPKIHTRIALCYKWLRNHLEAIEHYEKYLKATEPETPEAAKQMPAARKRLREAVQKTLEQLLRTISQLKLHVTAPRGAALRLNGQRRGRAPLNRVFRFNPGTVVVAVTAKDHRSFRQELTLVAGQTVSLSIELHRLKPDNRGGGAAADDL